MKYLEQAIKGKPLIINKKGKKVLAYTDVRNANLKKQKYSLVCCKDGKLSDKAVLNAYVDHLDFYDGLFKYFGAGNNLNKGSVGRYIEN